MMLNFFDLQCPLALVPIIHLVELVCGSKLLWPFMCNEQSSIVISRTSISIVQSELLKFSEVTVSV